MNLYIKNTCCFFWAGISLQKCLLMPGLFLLLTACHSNTQDTTSQGRDSTATEAVVSSPDSAMATASKLQPSGPKPEWAPQITPPMQTVIEKLASYQTPPLPTLSVAQARKAPSPTDAVMALMREKNIPMPPSTVDTAGKDIAVDGGKIHLRIYTPTSSAGPFPVIVYYHGGGWVIASLDTYHASAQALSEQTGAVLVSVAYRQAPEHKFPTAHNDSYAAYQWVVNNASSINGDAKRVAVVGESAGGNLAASVSRMAKQKGAMIPLHQLLIYPIADYDTTTQSYKQYATAKPLDKAMMQWFFFHYLRSPADGKNPMISLVSASDLKSMPSTTIIGAQLDPLQSEGKKLADQLKGAGVVVTYELYEGVTHEFFGMATLIPEAKQAQAFAARELKKAFSH